MQLRVPVIKVVIVALPLLPDVGKVKGVEGLLLLHTPSTPSGKVTATTNNTPAGGMYYN